MPNRDGTGPEGMGPGTGKGFGTCKKNGENLKSSEPRHRQNCRRIYQNQKSFVKEEN